MTENESLNTSHILLAHEKAVDAGELNAPNQLHSQEKEALQFILEEIQQYRAIGTIEELQALKDAEEQGLLLRLPCKIGDTVWFVDNDDDNYPIELCVTKIEVFKIYIFYRAVTTDDGTQAVFDCGDIGKTVFLTKEEAEQALANMQKA